MSVNGKTPEERDLIFKERMREIYHKTLADSATAAAKKLDHSIEPFFRQYESTPPWCIGPMKKDDSMTFRKTKQWADPTDTGWKSGFLFNPSAIEKDGKLFLFYRAAPKVETLCSRIGLAVYSEETGWKDYEHNPIVFPVEEIDEVYGTEDPKVYQINDESYILFYNGIAPMTEDARRELEAEGLEVPELICTVKAMVSRDLYHWERVGQIVPTSVSKYWAKAAVIPRNPQGKAIKIDGEYLMYLSEGCGGKQIVGHSPDMLHWSFTEQEYLHIDELGMIHEVACATVDYTDDPDMLLLDVFYRKKNGERGGLQVRYSRQNPFRQLEINLGATLCWGGLLQYKGKWICAQGWDAPEDREEIYFYTADIK